MSRNNDYTTGNLVNYLCHQNYYKLIDVDIARQKIWALLKKIILSEIKRRWWCDNVFVFAKK